MKTIKFRDFLVKLVLNGEKTSTWRLFVDKNLPVGNEVELINWNTKELFAKAILTHVREKNWVNSKILTLKVMKNSKVRRKCMNHTERITELM